MKHTFSAITLLAALLCSCAPKEQRLSIEAGNIKVTTIDSKEGAAEVRAILERYKAYIDSIKSPVLGEATVALEKYIPESPLMNFAADAPPFSLPHLILRLAASVPQTSLLQSHAITASGHLTSHFSIDG